MEIKSPLRYPGGKSRFTKLIAPLLGEFKEYREPFAGGASIFFHTKHNCGNLKQYWINDSFKDLYLFWHHAKNDNGALLEEIEKLRSKFTNRGKELYDFVKMQAESLPSLERAAAFFVMNRISFSGVSYSGGFSQQSYLGRFTDSSITRVGKIKTALHNVKITNVDYSELLNHKSQFNNEDVIIYCDPPYESVNQKSLYGKTGSHHKNFDCEKFADDMRNCKFRWVISYDDSEKIRSLFNFANIVDFSMYYSMKKGKNTMKIGNELLIKNFGK